MSQSSGIGNVIPILHERDHLCGSSDAPIVLMEYGDYECPRSSKCYFLIKQLQAQLGDRVSFVFRHFPLTHLHPQAQKAAETAEAAAAQDKFWQMHELLSQNSRALADSDLVEYAVRLNLDLPQFLQELSAHVHRERVKIDIQSGEQHGVQGTPAFFIGIRCQPDQDLEGLMQAILPIISFSPRKIL
jgi:protein-disulfide isomerase